jgi:DNA recombination protein RmuC
MVIDSERFIKRICRSLNMFEVILSFLSVAVTALIAYLFLKAQFSSELNDVKRQLSDAISNQNVSVERARSLLEQRDRLQSDVDQMRSAQTDLEKQISAKAAENESLKERLKEISKVKEDLNANMEDIMRRVHEASYDRATKVSHEKLSAVINPFKETLDTFGQTVRDTYDKGSKETLTLKNHLENFTTIQKGLMQQTESLTRALKGDSKVQGDWGELVLENLLESTGLREGHEFIVQGKGMGLKSESGSTRKPDVVVRLPKEKDVIVDSKISLTSYEQYFACETDEDRKQATEALVESIEAHIKDLSKKDYAALYGINAPDYVLMFIPIDGAYLLASQAAPGLYQRALEKGVHLVSPSFLMPALRLIHNLWERDKQSKNAIKIAEDAGRLYDKFVDFVADVQGVQDAITKAGTAAGNAMKKLQSGTGNLISRSENLRKLGAKAKKQIKLLNNLDEDESEIKSSDEVRSLTTDHETSAEELLLVAQE